MQCETELGPHRKPWFHRRGRVLGRRYRDPSKGRTIIKPTSTLSSNESTRPGLVWAFIHRYGDKPYTEELPTRKSVSIFLRNAVDPCIPCTFLCKGCECGSLRIAISCLTPYGLDSEVAAGSAADCIGMALERPLEIDYAKKGLMWNGYIPSAVRHFSGPMLNMALLDYFHRFSGVLPDFEYPIAVQQTPFSSISDSGERGAVRAAKRRGTVTPACWRRHVR